MKTFVFVVFGLALVSCDGGKKSGSSRRTKEERAADAAAVCDILKSAWNPELLGIAADAITFRPSAMVHPICIANWERPGHSQEEYDEKMKDWVTRKTQAMVKKAAFDEKMPKLLSNQVSLTLPRTDFSSDSDAVAALESLVKRLNEGITAKALGKEVTVTGDYEESWIEGVGDQAAWNRKQSQVSFAAKSRLVHLSVQIGDPAENRRIAIEMAKQVVEDL